MAVNRIGGTIQITINGRVYSPKGNFTYRINSKKKEGMTGAVIVEGYIEKPLIPFLEGEITDNANLNLAELQNVEDATITLKLANGKTVVFEHAWYAADGDVGTEEGNIQVRFEARSAEEI